MTVEHTGVRLKLEHKQEGKKDIGRKEEDVRKKKKKANISLAVPMKP